MNIKNVSTSFSIAMLLGTSLSVNAATPIQLTNNIYEDANPRIYHEHVVWNSWDGNDWEIFYHNLITGETRQITNNDSDDVMPDTDGTRIAWLPESDGLLPLVQLYDLSLDVSYGFDQYVFAMQSLLEPMIDASMPVAGPRIKDDKLLFGVGGSLWIAGYADEEPDPNVQLLGEYLGHGAATGDAFEFDYKFLEDGTVCWNGSTERETDPRYLLSYPLGDGTRGDKFVIKEDVDYPVLYTYHASVLTEAIPEYPQFEVVLGFEVIDTSPSLSCSDMQDGKLSITKQYDGGDYDLFWSYDGQGALPVTQDSANDTYARLSGNRMVWVKGEGANAEIYVAEIADSDDDQVPDYYDNCPEVANPGQEDSNGNGIGDACETTSSPASIVLSLDVWDSWSSGYCADIVVTNITNKTVHYPYGVTFTLPGNTQFTGSWNGDVQRSGENVTVIFPSWTQNIEANSQALSNELFGFCSSGNAEPGELSHYAPDFTQLQFEFRVNNQWEGGSTWEPGYCGKVWVTYSGSEPYIPAPNGFNFNLSQSAQITELWNESYTRDGENITVDLPFSTSHLNQGQSVDIGTGICIDGEGLPYNIKVN